MADEPYNEKNNDEFRSRDFGEPWNDGYASNDFEEETAAEISEPRPFSNDRSDDRKVVDDDDTDLASGSGAGIFAVVLSILSLFFLPVLLGIAGIVVGFIARRMGARALGNWAIGIGAAAIIMKVFFGPFF